MMDVDTARNAAMMLRWAADQLRDYAVLKNHEVGTIDHKIDLARNNVIEVVKTLGFTIVRTPSPDQLAHEAMLAARLAEGCIEAELYQGAPVYVGPDDGLQHDARGNVVGR